MHRTNANIRKVERHLAKLVRVAVKDIYVLDASGAEKVLIKLANLYRFLGYLYKSPDPILLARLDAEIEELIAYPSFIDHN